MSMQVFRPLQVFCNTQVLEQARRFYFTVSATLGINLLTGETLLDIDYLKETMPCLGDSIPDPGMPKPNGEVIISGKAFAPAGQKVPGLEVSISLGPIQKKLFVFGDRYWKPSRAGALAITEPAPFSEIEISFKNAFGGKQFSRNPGGKGIDPVATLAGNLVPLPNIEDPRRLIGLPDDRPEPAGFAPLDPAWPQRSRFHGTYDRNYKEKYFPGYPADHDWRFFLNAPQDQWAKEFFSGRESFALVNLHPEHRLVQGMLPDLLPRCFIQRKALAGPEFLPLDLNLDTVWFFPEKLIGLLTWRKAIEVDDDEAKNITHLLLAYERRSDPPRDLEYYRRALQLRLTASDPFLKNLNTQDLIPSSDKSAMELLVAMGLAGASDSPLADNLEARADAVKAEVNQKIEENLAQMQEQIDKNFKAEDSPGVEKPDLKQMLNQGAPKPDPEVEALKAKMELALPGVTSGDPAKIDFRNFSFDKLDEIMAAVSTFSDAKEKEGKEKAKEGLEKMRDQLRQQLEEAKKQGQPPEVIEGLENGLAKLEAVDLDRQAPQPLPRVNAEKIMSQASSLSPMLVQVAQQVEAMKGAGLDPERVKKLDELLREEMLGQKSEIEKAAREAETGFRQGYMMGAHFMNQGLSPHSQPVAEVRERFQLAASEHRAAGGDWACLDLRGLKLDGVDLTGCYLEQADLSGASLRGACFAGAILARANLAGADCTGADFTGANVGAVNGCEGVFREAKFKDAKLSKSNLTGADFTGANLEGAETLYIVIERTKFSSAHMPGITFIEANVQGSGFSGADLSGATFVTTSFRDCDFSGAKMGRCVFTDPTMENVIFDGAEMVGACFVVGDPEKVRLSNLSFRGAKLKQANLMGLDLRGSCFRGADLENCNLMESDLTGADLSQAFAPSAQLRKARLEGADLRMINLAAGSLAKAYLVKANLSAANLYGVDFLRATVVDTDFSFANLDNTLIENWTPR